MPRQVRRPAAFRAAPPVNQTARLPRAPRPPRRSITVDEEQREAYFFARKVGEVRYVTGLTANRGALCGLRVVEEQSDGTFVESTDRRALGVMRAYRAPSGSLRGLIRPFIRNRAIAGEVWLLVCPTEKRDGFTVEYVSGRELTFDPNGRPIRRTDLTTGLTRIVPQGSYWRKNITADPEYSDLPYSAVMGVLTEMKQLYQLRLMLDGVIKSRMTNDMLFLPNDLSFGGETPDVEGTQPDDAEDDIDPFTEALLDHMGAAIQDPTSAAAYVPLVVTGDRDPNGNGSGIERIQLAQNLGEWAVELREELVMAIARGLDVDPMQLEGRAKANHWGASQVETEFNTEHVIPEVSDFSEFTRDAFLRPLMRTWYGVPERETLRFHLEVDASEITARADKGVTALTLWDKGLIDDEAAVEANGFEDSSTPTDEQRRERLLTQIMVAHPETLPALSKFVPWLSAINASGPITLPSAPPPGNTASPSSPPTSTPTLRGPESGGGPPADPATEVLQQRVTTAAHFAILRALERAGSRAVSLAERSPSTRRRLRDVPKHGVVGALTIDDMNAMRTTPADLLIGAWDGLAAEVESWLVLAGTNRVKAQDVVLELTGHLQEVAERGELHRYSNGLCIPDELVAEVLRSVRR